MGSTSKGSETPDQSLGYAPPQVLTGHSVDNGFIWSQLAGIQAALGGLQESQKNLASALDKMDSKSGGKLSSIEADLAEIKQIRHTAKAVVWIVGIGFAGLIGVCGFVANAMWDTLKPMTAQLIQQAAAKTVQPPATK